MRTRRRWMLAVSAISWRGAMAQATQWQGSAQIATNGTTFTIPVHLQLEGKGTTLVGSFVDGPQRTTSTSGELSGQDITLHFAHYAVTFRGKSWATSLPATTPPIVDAFLTHLPCPAPKDAACAPQRTFPISTARGSYPRRALRGARLAAGYPAKWGRPIRYHPARRRRYRHPSRQLPGRPLHRQPLSGASAGDARNNSRAGQHAHPQVFLHPPERTPGNRVRPVACGPARPGSRLHLSRMTSLPTPSCAIHSNPSPSPAKIWRGN